MSFRASAWEDRAPAVVAATAAATLVLACAVIGWLHQEPFRPDTTWNPAGGASLFFLVWAGPRWWPAVFAANLAAILSAGAHGPMAAALVAAAATLAYAMTAIAARGSARRDSIATVRAVVRPAIPATLVLSAIVGVSAGWPADDAAGEIAATVLHHWIAELNGILVVLPALLVLRESPPARWRPDAAALLEAAGQLAAIMMVLWTVFAVAAIYNIRFFSLIFLPLIWVIARWGFTGTALTLLAVQTGIAVLAAKATTTVFHLQFLTLALCATGLTLGAVVTQRKRVETELEEKKAALDHALQVAAVGETTSALAHEMSQPVSALSRYLGACEVMAVEGDDPATLRETLRKAVAEAQRAADVVKRLRDFYRRGAVEISRVSPLSLVHSALKSAQPRLERNGIRVTTRPLEPLPDVAVDALQVETALLNVLNNAIDALSEWSERREITIAAGRTRDGIAITLSDTGPGIDEQIAKHLFEPFNTSKPSGMGMGLAISRSLLTASGATIALHEAGSRGASFIITLPPAGAAQEAG